MQDLAVLLDPDLTLPIGGTQFRVQCSARQGLRATRLIALGLDLDDSAELIEIRAALGGTYQQMQAAGVSEPLIKLAGRTAILHYGHSRDLAETYWQTAGTPGNPIPPSTKQKAMGEKIRSLFTRSASVTTNAPEHSPAHQERTGRTTPAVASSTRSPDCGTGTSPNRKRRRRKAR